MSSNQKSVHYKKAIVSFIDILGFRNLIEIDSPSAILSKINALRNFTSPHSSLSAIQSDGSDHVHTYSVSDAVVRIRYFQDENPRDTVLLELNDLLIAQGTLVSQGILIRGGVAIGNIYSGSDDHNTVFGPAFVRAYEIESKKAIFPRIAIDQSVYDLALPRSRRQQEADIANDIQHLVEMLVRSSDGTISIDYLIGFQAEFSEYADWTDFLRGHRFTIQNLLSNQTNKRVLEKLFWLREYHNNFVSMMAEGIDLDIDGDEAEITAKGYAAQFFVP